ncbi:4-hydroxy-tetrahydrodipicolinate synthase [Nocardia huaxiensis]|uniref:4-hydroxy-tetrahydrodipicolinate synthase n=1 Tax=Nocardia huaxiensis TaxID=2755382 RepID=A0A7D6VE64_9NOCA|nr:4-hydroxy-tetrahydrodipicolinate synthase [Nocardia huaxiensis]QLY33191.1 4-hydroxy-tetrahydrodipicolinate synthase [Nocardia huaxiensis]UFS99884.1 4-hydroxy-tetrahydrodipicolinate synthase [Nocardia huaxiensis]
MTLSGLFVPLVTPFDTDGTLAADALERLACDILADGATGLVALGTTAEAAMLTDAERTQVIDLCVRVCREHNAPLIVGAGTNATAASLEAVGRLRDGITAALTVVPYYTRPTEAGVLEHFRRVAAASPVPLVVYNIPYRTGRTLSTETLLALADIPNIAGVKHAVGALDDTTIELMAARPADFAVLAGDDLYAAPLLALGAPGAILATAIVATGAYASLVSTWQDGPIGKARDLSNRLAPIATALFAEPNPTVIKAVLAAQGRIPTPTVRLPLLPAEEASTAAALAALERLAAQ